MIVSPVILFWEICVSCSAKKNSVTETERFVLEFSLRRPLAGMFLFDRDFSSVDCSIQVTLKPRGRPEIVYEPEKCEFKSKQVSYYGIFGDDDVEGGEEISFSLTADDQPWQDVMFSREICRQGNQCEITVTMKVPAELFKLDLQKPLAMPFPKPVPDTKDFRFCDYLDSSENDFTFACSDGQVTANRTSLFQCSEHFRNLFRSSEGRAQIQMNVGAPVAAVKTLLLYLFTDCFEINDLDLNVTVIGPLLSLISQYVEYNRQSGVMRAIELCCVKKVLQVSDDLTALMPWLVYVGSVDDSIRRFLCFGLSNICQAILLKHHWNDYLLEYFRNQKELSPEKALWKAALTSDENGHSLQDEFLAMLANSVAPVELNKEMDE